MKLITIKDTTGDIYTFPLALIKICLIKHKTPSYYVFIDNKQGESSFDYYRVDEETYHQVIKAWEESLSA